MAAAGALALDPLLLGDFFYHPRALALVHLVTLGWITCSILGALYIVGPTAMRVAFPAGRIDWAAFAAVVVGTSGMIAHFWLDSYGGMVWSAGTLIVGTALVGVRVLPALARAPIAGAVKAYPILAFANLLVAGTLGALIGLEKLGVVALPGFLLASVFAHAHLAALGWATMMVMGTGYRLLPMQLPAAAPTGHRLWIPAVLMQAGVLGLAVSLMLDSSWIWLFAAAIVTSLLAYARDLVTMVRSRRPSPRGLIRPDLSMGHTVAAFLYLGASAVVGVSLLALPRSAVELRVVFVYGVLALLGFLAQLVVGIGGRLLPMAAWMQRFVRGDFTPPDVSQYAMQDRRLQAATLVLWNVAVLGLAGSLYAQWQAGVAASALALLGAVSCEAGNRILMARYWFSN